MTKSRRIILCLINDVALAFLAFPTACFIRFHGEGFIDRLMDAGLSSAFFFVGVVVFVSFLAETYKLHYDLPFSKIVPSMMLFFGLSFLLLSVLGWARPALAHDSGMVAVFIVLFYLFQFLSHLSYRTCSRFHRFANRILILGTGPLAQEVGKAIPTSTENYVLSGYVSLDTAAAASGMIGKGAVDTLDEIVKREKAHKIVVSLSERRGVLPLRQIMNCKLAGVDVVDAPSFYEQLTGKLLVENITPGWFIFSEGFKVTSFCRAIKRVADVACVLVAGIILLPFVPLIALAIRMDSPGPVFFRQVRVGEKGEEFTLFKFRTMREDAERGTGAVWAQEKDPRVTRVGAFFRKSRIDEIPQLYNVLKGDMSIVGPRPERPEFVQQLQKSIPYYAERHVIKPGITGWAQVSYPYGASEADALEKLRYDLYYIKNMSLWFDVMIILATVRVVLRRGGR